MLRKSRVVGSQMELRSCQRRRSSLRSSTTSVTKVPASAPAMSAPQDVPPGRTTISAIRISNRSNKPTHSIACSDWPVVDSICALFAVMSMHTSSRPRYACSC